MIEDMNTTENHAAEEMVQQVQEEHGEQEQHEQTPEEKPQKQQFSHEDNLVRLRESKKRLEREKQELAERLKAYEAAQQQEKEADYTINPDDLVEGKHLSKYDKEIKALKEQYASTTAEIKLKNAYPDFDKVVNQDTISSFRELYPELATTLYASRDDIYNTSAALYTMIKKFGIYAEDTHQKEREVAHANNAKPRPLTSISPQKGESPLTRANAFANGLTDDLKKSLLQEMANARKNL